MILMFDNPFRKYKGLSDRVKKDYKDGIIYMSSPGFLQTVNEPIKDKWLLDKIQDLETHGHKVIYVVFNKTVYCEHYHFLLNRCQKDENEYFVYNYDYNMTTKKGEYRANCFNAESGCLVRWK